MLAALLLVADLTGACELTDRSEVRVRVPGTAPHAASVDAETAPRLQLSLASPDWRASVAYSPRLTLWDLGNDSFQPTVLDQGEAHLEWIGHRARLALDQSGAYGGVGFASQAYEPSATGQLPRLEAIPTTSVVDYAASRTALGSTVTLRRLVFTTTAGYELAGGATPSARALLPLVMGPFGEASADYAVTRIDGAITRIQATDDAFSSGPDAALVQVDETWRHAWSRLTETRLGAGASAAAAREPPRMGWTYTPYPVVEGTFERRAAAGAHVDVRLDVRLGPEVNRLYGVVDERVEGSLMAVHRYGRFAAHLFASASQSVVPDSIYATSMVGGELGGSYATSKFVALDAGVRAFGQRIAGVQALLLQSTFFVGVSLRAPRARW